MFKITKTKYLLKCLYRHLHHFLINKELINYRLNSFNDDKLYKKSSKTNIKKIDIFVDEINHKSINSYRLLKQRLEW